MFVSGPVAKIVTGSSAAASVVARSASTARARVERHVRLRQLRPVEPALAVHVDGRLERAAGRTLGAGRDRHVADAGERADAARVERDLVERRVAADGRDRAQVERRVRGGEQERDRVVVTRGRSRGCRGSASSDDERDDAGVDDVDEPAVGQLEVGDHREREEAERHERRVDRDALLGAAARRARRAARRPPRPAGRTAARRPAARARRAPLPRPPPRCRRRARRAGARTRPCSRRRRRRRRCCARRARPSTRTRRCAAPKPRTSPTPTRPVRVVALDHGQLREVARRRRRRRGRRAARAARSPRR